MTVQATNYISFKSVQVKEYDTKTKKSLSEVFSTGFKQKVLSGEMKKLNEISGDTDLFISSRYVKNDNKTGGKIFEFMVIDKGLLPVALPVYLSTTDNFLMLKTSFDSLNERLIKRLKNKD